MVYRERWTIFQSALRYVRYHTGMTHPDLDSQLVHQVYDADYDPEVVNYAIAALHQIGYTVVSPFVREAHIKACLRIVDACDDVEDGTTVEVSDAQITALCTLALTHLSKLDSIVEVISQRRIVDIHEVNSILRVIERITENT